MNPSGFRVIKRILPVIAFVLALCLAVPFIAGPPADRQASVRIGALVPLSGNFQSFGVVMKNAMLLAEETVNQEGGIHGRPLEVIFADTQGRASLAESVVKELTEDRKAVMLVGGYSSDATFSLAKTAQRRDVPFVVCTASADRITQMGWENIYRINPPVSEYTQGLEDFWIKEFRPKSIAVIFENSMFGTDGAKRMTEFCRENAIELRALVPYDKAMTRPAYFRSLIAPLTLDPPEVIYMISYLEDAVTLVRQIREVKINSLLCGDAGGFTLNEFIQRTGKDAEGLLTTTLWSRHLPYSGADAFHENYVNRFNDPPDYHAAEAYAAVLVAADVLKRAGSHSPQAIRKALNQTVLMTPFGPVKFYNYHRYERQNSIRTLVLQIIIGRFTLIWPPEFAESGFIPPAILQAPE